MVAAIDALSSITEGLPLMLAGWSFGADVALTVDDGRISGWLAVAPPLRTVDSDGSARSARWAAGGDPHPTLLVVPEHDQFRDPASAAEATRGWVATRMGGVGATDDLDPGHAPKPGLRSATIRRRGSAAAISIICDRARRTRRPTRSRCRIS